jgi:hypothetical protein
MIFSDFLKLVQVIRTLYGKDKALVFFEKNALLFPQYIDADFFK